MKKMPDFKPKMISAIKNYNRQTFMADLMAGIIVGIVALPLAIAFGIASGVSPEKGIITAIVAGLAISLLGGSKVQIGGPTGAFIVIVAGIINQYGIQGLTVATLMAGVFLIGLMNGLSAVIISLLLAIICTLIRNKVKKTKEQSMPLIPYLSIGFLTVILTGGF